MIDFLGSKPRIFFLPNPNQPIEDTLTIDQIDHLAKTTMGNDTLLVIDEAYYYFGADSAKQLIEQYPNIINPISCNMLFLGVFQVVLHKERSY